MHFDDALDQGQANPCPVPLQLQPFEEAKDLLVVPWINPHTVILYIVDRFFLFLSTSNLNPWSRLSPHKLDGVIHEVLQDLQEPGAVPYDGCDRAIPTMEGCEPERIRLLARGPLWWNAGS